MLRLSERYNIAIYCDSIKPREVKRSPGNGEDSVSFERHNNVLRTEWTKSNRNAMLVEQLIKGPYFCHS